MSPSRNTRNPYERFHHRIEILHDGGGGALQ